MMFISGMGFAGLGCLDLRQPVPEIKSATARRPLGSAHAWRDGAPAQEARDVRRWARGARLTSVREQHDVGDQRPRESSESGYDPEAFPQQSAGMLKLDRIIAAVLAASSGLGVVPGPFFARRL
jgi:hypothetical protein